mgnify:CR=1 FL=1
MSNIDSRSAEIDTDKCVANAGANRFDMIIAASMRTRELKRQHKESGKHVGSIDALLEIQEGKLDVQKYLDKLAK